MMAEADVITLEDLRQITEHGLTKEEIIRQLGLFKRSKSYLKLVRPCVVGDGINAVHPETIPSIIETFEKESPDRMCIKLVPASGAASRMFKVLLAELGRDGEILLEKVKRRAESGLPDQQALFTFMNRLRSFAFFQDLKQAMSRQGIPMEKRLAEGRFREIIECLLSEHGLNYAQLPKGLLKFHAYEDEARTAFEEHLVESVSYVQDKSGKCPLHFTISPEHMERFTSFLESIRPRYEKRFEVSFDVSFSLQKGSTDTIAADMDNLPFRDENGRLVFRPGGHGALIENLNDLKGDIIFLKNIDNVVPDSLKEETFRWKKVLGGYLLKLEKQVHAHMAELSNGVEDPAALEVIMGFAEDELQMVIPYSISTGSSQAKRDFMMDRLNRPIRVCGMVRNEGEPGGGPFWVEDTNGGLSLQIVEAAQVNRNLAEQAAVLKSATHFNPVDLVCAVRDWQGRAFDLRKYVDQDTVFVSRKSKDGKELKALEHPGLWNGAMAGWITVFVEVPLITFNPVKTVNDLLRKEHQP